MAKKMVFKGRPNSLDAAFEREAMQKGLVHTPVFSENKDFEIVDDAVQHQEVPSVFLTPESMKSFILSRLSVPIMEELLKINDEGALIFNPLFSDFSNEIIKAFSLDHPKYPHLNNASAQEVAFGIVLDIWKHIKYRDCLGL